MANRSPVTKVRRSLQLLYPLPSAPGVSNCKLPMTEVKGSMICDINFLTMGHMSAWVDYITSFHFRYCIYEF